MIKVINFRYQKLHFVSQENAKKWTNVKKCWSQYFEIAIKFSARNIEKNLKIFVFTIL